MEVLRTCNLTKKYNEEFAVDNVCMTINKGDIYGFVGKNGAGKTTLIRLLMKLIKKNNGQYYLFGIEDSDTAIYDSLKKCQAIIEDPAVYKNMTAYENMLCQADLYNIKDKNKLIELLSTVGLKYNDKKKVRNFSLGMRQRLAIALSLINEPEFLILDEPMNGLDPEGIVELRELLLKLNQERGLTILMSSHILGELSKIATKYGFINKGKLIKEVDASEVLQNVNMYIEIIVDDINKATKGLDESVLKECYSLKGEHIIKINKDITVTELVNIVSKYGAIITNFTSKKVDIEEYFIDLIGGLKEW